MKRSMLFLLACLLETSTSLARQPERPFGDTRVLAPVAAAPGFPEGIGVNGNKVYVVGPAAFDTAGFLPTTLSVFDTRTGAATNEFALRGEDTSLPHSSSGIAFDKKGRVYVLGTQIGVARVDVDHGTQQSYASVLPDLPPCAVGTSGPCSETADDRPPLPNDMVFDEDGNLYISDTFQASIFKVPNGGGKPELWLSDSTMAGVFGINGLRFDTERKHLIFVNTDPTVGGMFSIALERKCGKVVPGAITMLHAYPGEGPDGFAVGKSGKMYVALAFSNQISVLRPDGSEVARIPAVVTPSSPYSNPSGIAFNGRGSLLVTNHAIFDPAPADKFAVFDVWVDDDGNPLETPKIK